jgi:tRNA(Ile)-lysidine synthetase-like protein
MASISPVVLPHIVVRLLTLAWAYFHRHNRILPPYWGISSVHVSALCGGLESKVLGRCSLPTDAFSEWNGKSLVIVRGKENSDFYCYRLELGTPLLLPELGYGVYFSRGSLPDGVDGIVTRLPIGTSYLTVRAYLDGDRYQPKGALIDRCVWKLMKSRHVLPFKRDSLPLFFYEHQLLWGLGLVSVHEGALKFNENAQLDDYTIYLAPL